MEEYKIIKDFENYEISNFGNIKNVKTGRILKNQINNHGYYKIDLCKDGKTFNKTIHKLVANEFIPNPLNKNCIDHIDNNRLNNNINNLRWATHQENNMNRNISSKNTSGFKGVFLKKETNKWCAQIRINGKLMHLGLFDKIEDAVIARVEKSEELFGEYKNSCEKIININIENLNLIIKNDEVEIAELEKELEAIINRK